MTPLPPLRFFDGDRCWRGENYRERFKFFLGFVLVSHRIIPHRERGRRADAALCYRVVHLRRFKRGSAVNTRHPPIETPT